MASTTTQKNNTFAAGGEEQALPVAKGNTQKGFLISQAFVRILALISSAAALALMVTSKQTIYLFGIQFDAYYSYASAFRYLFVVDAVVGCFSVVSLVLLCSVGRSPSAGKCFCLFLHDVLVMLVIMSGCSAASAIGYVGKYGQEKMGWMALCNRVTKFCNQVTVSLVFSYVAFFCFLALTILSASKLMSPLPR